MLKVCLIDSHPSFRLGLRQILQANFVDIHIGEFSNYALFSSARDETFDLIVASVNEDTQLHVVRKLSGFPYRHSKIIVFYTNGHYNNVLSRLSKRVSVFLNKSTEVKTILETLEKVVNEPEEVPSNSKKSRRTSPVFPSVSARYKPGFQLSEREFEIAYYLAKGMKTTDISNMMQIKPSTVSTHKHRIFRKTETANIIELRDLMHL